MTTSKMLGAYTSIMNDPINLLKWKLTTNREYGPPMRERMGRMRGRKQKGRKWRKKSEKERQRKEFL